MTESISSDFVRQVRLALEVLAGGSSISPTDELAALVGGGTKLFAIVGLSATQNTNINANDHIEFDQIEQENAGGSGIAVSTGAGQLAGLITLPQGHVFKVTGYINTQFNSATNTLILAIRNNTDAVVLEPHARIIVNTNSGGSDQPISYIDTTAEAKEIEVRIVSETAFITFTSNLGGNGQTYLDIQEV